MNRISFFIKEALRSIGRNPIPSFAALMAVLITVLVLGIFIPAVQIANGAASDVRDRVQLKVFMKTNATDADVDKALTTVKSKDHVKEAKIVTKEEALAEQKKLNPVAYATLGKNPLPDAIIITPDDASNVFKIRSSLMATSASGKAAPLDSTISKIQTAKGTKKIDKLTGGMKIILGVLATLLVLASILLISNTVRLSLFSRRREIEVMKLVGATDSFIRWPFVIEGLILGAVGGLAAIVLLVIGKFTVLDSLEGIAVLISRPDMIGFAPLIGILVLASVVVAALGSGLSLRRFLRV